MSNTTVFHVEVASMFVSFVFQDLGGTKMLKTTPCQFFDQVARRLSRSSSSMFTSRSKSIPANLLSFLVSMLKPKGEKWREKKLIVRTKSIIWNGIPLDFTPTVKTEESHWRNIEECHCFIPCFTKLNWTIRLNMIGIFEEYNLIDYYLICLEYPHLI